MGHGKSTVQVDKKSMKSVANYRSINQIYILNGTPGHAEIYKTTMGEGETEMRACLTRLISVPMGVSVFPIDPMYAQRWWAEAAVGKKVVFWKEHDEGGHFASVEKPLQLIEDIRSFTAAAKLVVTK